MNDFPTIIDQTEAIDGTTQISASLTQQQDVLASLKDQFNEFVNKADYIQQFAETKSKEIDTVKDKIQNQVRDQEQNAQKAEYLEVR